MTDIPETPRGSNPLVLVDSLGIGGLASASLAAGRLILPTFAIAVGAGVPVAGLLASMMTVVSIFFSHRVGRLIDTVGPMVPMLFSLAMITVAPLVYFVLPVAPVLLLTAVLTGTGAMFAHIASTRAVGEAGLDSDRTRNLSYLVLCYSFAQLLGPMLAGWSFEHIGPAWGLSTIAVFSGLALLALLLLPHNFTRFSEARRRSRAAEVSSMFSLLALPTLRLWLSSSTVFVGVLSFYPFVVAIHAVNIGISAAQAGVVLGFYAGGSFVARLGTPLALRLMKREWLIVSALAMGCLEYMLIPFTRTFHAFALFSGILGLSLAIGVPLTLSLIYEYAPKGNENGAVGLGTAMSNILQTLLPLSLTFLPVALGIAPMLWTLSAAMAVLALTITRRQMRGAA